MTISAWEIFSGWGVDLPMEATTPFIGDWGSFDSLDHLLEKHLQKQAKELLHYLKDWDFRLKDLGGEPSYYDWGDFRPLRLGQEEDWSDWLYHLILSSRTGYFSKQVFNLEGFSQEDYCKVLDKWREPPSECYRADILINWLNHSFTHLEVKVGDPNLEKTLGTALAMRNRFQKHNERWFDMILLKRFQLPAWDDIKTKTPSDIRAITWEDIAIALRKSLVHKGEDLSWMVWARTFLGAIEQKLLGFPYIKKGIPRVSDSLLEQMIQILVKGVENG